MGTRQDIDGESAVRPAERRGAGVYVPVWSILDHPFFLFTGVGYMAERGYEWWTTPMVIPAKRGLVCFWRMGTWWKRVRYSEIEEISSTRWLGREQLGIRLRGGKTIVLGAHGHVWGDVFAGAGCYYARELRKTREAILRNLRAAEAGESWERLDAGSGATVWRRTSGPAG